MVLRHDGPSVRELPDARLAGVDHGLDGERHAGLERHSSAGLAVMLALRLLLELAAGAVPAELAHNRESVALGMLLDRCANTAQPGSRAHLEDPAPHAIERHFPQPLRLDAR